MKKLLVILLALIVLTMGAFLIACDDDTPDNNDGGNTEQGGAENSGGQSGGEVTPSCTNHVFTSKIMTTEYAKVMPTCQTVGEYYYKCETCTAKGTEIYKGTEIGPHLFTSKTQTVPFLKSEANCESPTLYYYKCQYCNAKGTETYEVGSEAHNLTVQMQTSEYLKSAATCQSPAEYYYKCSLCSDHGTSTYNVGTKTKHDLDTNHICTMCSNGYIYFGEYPQTIKAESVTITTTTDSRGYYLGSDNAYYAKITANPYESGYRFSNESSVTEGTVYYFKVEPILWRIISQSSDTIMLLCDGILANISYQSNYSYSNDCYYTSANGASDGTYSNSYKYSEVRAWLNEQFYNTAFTDFEKELILTTTVDNSVASTGFNLNPYACENTSDRIFLFSYSMVKNSVYGFNSSTDRKMLTSDFSRATGAIMSTNSYNYGSGLWWLRSPYGEYSYLVRGVYSDGSLFYNYSIHRGCYGVVPALKIRL